MNSSQQTKYASFQPSPIWVHQSEINQYVRFHLTCGHILINQVNLSPRLAELWHYELKTFTKRPSVLSAADRGLQSSCAIVHEFIWISFDNRLFSMLDHIISNAQPYRRWTMNKNNSVNNSRQTKHASFQSIPICAHRKEINQCVKCHESCDHQVNLLPGLAELWPY